MTLNNSADLKGISQFTIVKILKKFSPKEITEMDKLLSSPFFNNHSIITRLYRELKKFYPHFSDKKLTKKYLFEIISPGKKYDDQLFQKYLSLLNKMAEEYMSILELQSNKNEKDLKILYQLSRRDLNEVYSRKLKEIERKSDNHLKIDEYYYLYKHKLSDIKYYHNARGNNLHPGNEELKESYNCLIYYLLINSSSTLCQLFSDKLSYKYSEPENSYGIFYSRSEIEKNVSEIIKSTPSKDEKLTLFLELIRNDLKMNFEKSDITVFENIRKILFGNSEVLSNSLLLYYFKRLNMYCSYEIAKGNYLMDKVLFENYKFMLEKNLFYEDDIPNLQVVDYRIILFTALRNNQIEWAEKFIVESSNLITEESRNNISNFGFAVLQFHKKNYSGSLDHISMIKHEMLPVTIDVYVLKAKLFYEFGFFDTSRSVADSLRHFIKNNKVISDTLKNSLRNFIRLFFALMSLNNNYSEAKYKKLFFETENSKLTWNKIWLIEKLNELRDLKSNLQKQH